MSINPGITAKNVVNSYSDEAEITNILPHITHDIGESIMDNQEIEFYKTTNSDNQLNIKLDKINPRMKIKRNSYKGGKKRKHAKIGLIKCSKRPETDTYNSHVMYNPKGEKQELIDKLEDLKVIQDQEVNEYGQAEEEVQEPMVVINKKKAMKNYFRFAEKQRVKSGVKKTK